MCRLYTSTVNTNYALSSLSFLLIAVVTARDSPICGERWGQLAPFGARARRLGEASNAACACIDSVRSFLSVVDSIRVRQRWRPCHEHETRTHTTYADAEYDTSGIGATQQVHWRNVEIILSHRRSFRKRKWLTVLYDTFCWCDCTHSRGWVRSRGVLAPHERHSVGIVQPENQQRLWTAR